MRKLIIAVMLLVFFGFYSVSFGLQWSTDNFIKKGFPSETFKTITTYCNDETEPHIISYKIENEVLLVPIEAFGQLFAVTTEWYGDVGVVFLDEDNDDEKIIFVGSNKEIYYGVNGYKVNFSALYEKGINYIPLSTAVAIMDGAVVMEGEDLHVYTQAYIDQGIKDLLIKKRESINIDVLDLAMTRLEKEKHIRETKRTHHLEQKGSPLKIPYDENRVIQESCHVSETVYREPLTQYIRGSRKRIYASDDETLEEMTYIAFVTDLSIGRMHPNKGETELNWKEYANSGYEEVKVNKQDQYLLLKPFLKYSEENNEYSVTLHFKDDNQWGRIALFRQLYEGNFLEHYFKLPLDTLVPKEMTVTYKVDGEGYLVESQEKMLIHYNDGEESFDIRYLESNHYSLYN